MTNKELEKQNKELEKNIIEMAKVIKELAEDVKSLKEKPIEKPAVKPVETPSVPDGATSQFPVPPEYRELVNMVLNKYFGVEIEWKPQGFSFTVIVPDKYSPLTQKDREGGMRVDRRTKIIPNYEGADGVRKWVELIYSSFAEETKALIVANR